MCLGSRYSVALTGADVSGWSGSNNAEGLSGGAHEGYPDPDVGTVNGVD